MHSFIYAIFPNIYAILFHSLTYTNVKLLAIYHSLRCKKFAHQKQNKRKMTNI